MRLFKNKTFKRDIREELAAEQKASLADRIKLVQAQLDVIRIEVAKMEKNHD